MESAETLTETLARLREEGYTVDFNLQENCLICTQGKYTLLHDEFHVDQVFRFDDNTDPADEAVLYAISSDKHDVKGTLVNGYGIYSDHLSDDIMKKLAMHP